MVALPSPQTPLYHHPLPSLEAWLGSLGARQHPDDLACWELDNPQWHASIRLEVEDLRVSWQSSAGSQVRQFPYGLSRLDVESAILAGP